MLALKIEYVLGRSVATEYKRRDRAEWPPHPARVFSALVATWAAEETPSDSERAALEWLEMAGAPAICASNASRRTVVPYYVPDNPASIIKQKAREAVTQATLELERIRDAAVDSKREARSHRAAENKLRRATEALALELAPMHNPTSQDFTRARALGVPRTARQERYFPSVTPDEPLVYLIWKSDPTPENREALSQLVRRVIRIGHSSSVVRCTLVDAAPEPNWFPDDEHGDMTFRVVGPGQLERLGKEFERHQETEPRILPCRYQRYRQGAKQLDTAVTGSVFGLRWIVFRRVGGPRLPLSRTADVAQALRGALMKNANQPVPEILSGHDQDRKPSQRPHVAFVPLPSVGHRHSDGAILGVALIVPSTATDEERRSVLQAVDRWEKSRRREEDEENPTLDLQLGSAGVLEIEKLPWDVPASSTLEVATWSRPSRSWISVTPVALDRNPGDLYANDVAKAEAAYADAAESLALSCERIGLPRPERVDVLPSTTLPGTMKARQFPPFPKEAAKGRRVQVHAYLEFKDPVEGPVLLGAGRYLGLGLFRPCSEGR